MTRCYRIYAYAAGPETRGPILDKRLDCSLCSGVSQDGQAQHIRHQTTPSAVRFAPVMYEDSGPATNATSAPKGLIRVTVPPTFARLHMVSKLPAFFAAYPDMAVEMGVSRSPTTIIEDGFDLAIHSGDLPDATLVARKFAQTTTILVATPQSLTRHGAPQSPDGLNRFQSVVFVERVRGRRESVASESGQSVPAWETSGIAARRDPARCGPAILPTRSCVAARQHSWRDRRG
jgi:DNA-binding transcriptional LysR family regulator